MTEDIKKRVERVETKTWREQTLYTIAAGVIIGTVILWLVSLSDYSFFEYSPMQDSIWASDTPETAGTLISVALLMFILFSPYFVVVGYRYFVRLYVRTWKKYFLKEFPEFDCEAIEKTTASSWNAGQRFSFPVVAKCVVRYGYEPDEENSFEKKYLSILKYQRYLKKK